jgi:hypothetical protein
LVIQKTVCNFAKNIVNMEASTIKEIRATYPNQWVLIGDPVLDDPNTLGSIVSKLVKGVVLLANADKKELAYKAKEVRKGHKSYTCIYTGEIPKNRKFWL